MGANVYLGRYGCRQGDIPSKPQAMHKKRAQGPTACTACRYLPAGKGAGRTQAWALLKQAALGTCNPLTAAPTPTCPLPCCHDLPVTTHCRPSSVSPSGRPWISAGTNLGSPTGKSDIRFAASPSRARQPPPPPSQRNHRPPMPQPVGQRDEQGWYHRPSDTWLGVAEPAADPTAAAHGGSSKAPSSSGATPTAVASVHA